MPSAAWNLQKKRSAPDWREGDLDLDVTLGRDVAVDALSREAEVVRASPDSFSIVSLSFWPGAPWKNGRLEVVVVGLELELGLARDVLAAVVGVG